MVTQIAGEGLGWGLFSGLFSVHEAVVEELPAEQGAPCKPRPSHVHVCTLTCVRVLVPVPAPRSAFVCISVCLDDSTGGARAPTYMSRLIDVSERPSLGCLLLHVTWF